MSSRPRSHTNNVIRIALSGAPGVGKTSVLDELSTRFRGHRVAVSKEIARNLVKAGFRINKESQAEDYFAFLTFHLKRTRELDGDLIFFDRTLIDVLCFMEVNGNASDWLKNLTDELIQWQVTLFSSYFYIPPEFKVKPDGFRATEQIYIEKFDATLRSKLGRYFPGFITLRGTLEDRLSQAFSEVQSKLFR